VLRCPGTRRVNVRREVTLARFLAGPGRCASNHGMAAGFSRSAPSPGSGLRAKAERRAAAATRASPPTRDSFRLVRIPSPMLARAFLTCTGSFFSRTARAVKIVVRHGGIPRPIRWLAALGLLPVPGPFDEAVLLLVALIMFVFYRSQLHEAWAQAKRGRFANPT
jgi:hypothetical protein